MDVSIVVPAYNEAENVPVLCMRVRDALNALAIDWELIIVDDGSTDESFAVIRRLNAADGRVRGLRLSRNFGQQLALYAGLCAARGRAVITMDADLRHPPEVLPQVIERWRAGAAIVHTIADETRSRLSLPKRVTARLFYWLFRKLARLDLYPGMGDFRLFDRAVVDVLVASPEHRPFLRGFATWVGFPQAKIRFAAGHRLHGESRYTLGKMVRLALSGFVGFSTMPLYGSLALGLLGFIASLGYALYVMVTRFAYDSPITDWTYLTLVLGAVTSVQFVAIGVLGMYVGHISRATSGRPRVVVAQRTLEGITGSAREPVGRDGALHGSP